MIVLDDKLYQWDSGHYVTLTGDDAKATEVHFAQYCAKAEALVVAVREQDGAKIADVPNSYLVDDKDICAWSWVDDQTISGSRFGVWPRARPSDYVYQPTDVLNYEHLKQWVMDEFAKFKVENASDYTSLKNKPRINDVELVGNKQLSEIGIEQITDDDIDSLFN